MTKDELLQSRQGIPPMAHKTKRPSVESGKYKVEELPRLAIEDYEEMRQIDAMTNCFLDFE